MTTENLVLLGLVIFGFLFFLSFLPKFSREFRLLEFIKHPLVSIISLFLFGSFLHFALHKYGMSDFEFIAEALIVVSLIGLLLEVPHIKEFFLDGIKEAVRESIGDDNNENISGYWFYEVRDLNGVVTHKGSSKIKQIGKNIYYIHGRRTHSQGIDGQLEELPGYGIPWSTEFALVHGESTPKLSFVYGIEISPNGFIEVFCSLDLGDPPFDEMCGQYTHLAPNKSRGHIALFRNTQDHLLQQPKILLTN